jgi:hypothetical protein
MRNTIKRFAAALVVAVGIPVALAGLAAAPADGIICIRGLSIQDQRDYEGTPTASSRQTPFVFTVTSIGCTTSATVHYETQHTTTNSYDLAATSGTLTFPAGDASSRSVVVWVQMDGSPGPNESFVVRLSNAAGTLLADSTAVGTISNDDTFCVPPPEVPPGADYHCAE